MRLPYEKKFFIPIKEEGDSNESINPSSLIESSLNNLTIEQPIPLYPISSELKAF